MAKRRQLRWGIAAAVALVAVATLAAYTWSRPLTVTVAQVEKDVPIQVFGLGTVEAQTVSRIGFETAGTLVELHADHGDTVKAGTLLGGCRAASRKRASRRHGQRLSRRRPAWSKQSRPSRKPIHC
jgi:HlyD family secretion protein